MSRSCSRPACRRARRRSPTSTAGSPIEDGDRFWKITLTPDDGGEEIVYEKLSKRQWLAMTVADGAERPLADGDHVHVGQLLLEGTADPHEVLRVMGPREVQLHLVREVQKVYRTQSVDIHDKHIEVIVRQMLRRVTIIDSGATEFLPGALAERARVRVGEPPRGGRGRRAGLRSSGADGDHEGLAGHGVVAVRGLVPGDHPRSSPMPRSTESATSSSGSRRT